ncbi:MAG TPA: choice-of-anchor D domain-containing protein, partial [Tepidisphaeraceae bacterium]|nr:choice-of-anchor D domain-containing protein [Tepidisphaeraceae bacterium]
GGNAAGDNLLLDMERIVGGTGDDFITGSDAANSFSPGAGDDTVLAGPGNDTVDGDSGDDSLAGEGGDDQLAGQSGNDTLLGGTGDDAFITNDLAADTLDGGAGTDTATADLLLDSISNIELGVIIPEPEVAVTVGGNDLPDGTVSVSFGSATQGAAGPTRTFTVRNDGNDVLVVGAVSVPAGFTVIDPLVGPIAPGASESFTVRLDTAVSGTFGGQVSFSNTDADENPYNFSVSGTVVEPPPQLPEVTVLVGGSPITDGAGSFNFGSVIQGAAGPTRTFTVRNDGTGTLTLGAINLPAGFTLIDGLPTSLAAGASDSFTVRLDTGTAAVRSGTITVVNNDTDEDPFDIAIGGAVVAPTPPAAPEVTVTQARPAGPIDDGNSTVEFGNGVAGTRGATRTFRVRNDGDAVLTLGAVTAPAGFTIIDFLPAQLAPGEAESFVVQVDTTTPGRKDGFVSFATNDVSEGTFTFRLIANVGVTAVALPESTINSIQAHGNLRGVVDGVSAFSFGTVAPGARAPARTFRVANNGNADLALGKVVVPAGFVVTDDIPGVLAPGATDLLVIAMATGGAIGSRGGIVSIATNDSDENPYTWTVSGTLAQPQAPAGSPEVTVRLTDGTNIADGATVPVSFGAVAFAGKAPTRTFRVSNTGTASLTLGAINVPAGFALMSPLGVSALAPGATASFTLGLRTDGGGVKSGRVTFATNDANENPFDFAVSGSVSAAQTPTTAVTGSVSASGTLSVNGTPGIDTVSFASSSRGLSVVGNGVAVNGSPFNGVRRIVVNGFDGADRIDASGLAIPVTILGGNGNDTLIGGDGPDSLSGGANNDVLTGGPGLDVLRGDDGDDLLNAQDGLADSHVDGGAGNDTIRKDRTDSGSGT